jgi:hypothetical protein
MEKKKRGRKPKNNIILNENPVFDNLKGSDNLIACIKKNTIKNEIIISDKIEGIEETNNLCFLEDNIEIEKKCWNCCHSIEGNIISYPILYTNDIFYTNGNFCSYECSARYIFDNFNHKEIWEKYNLLNFYYNVNTNNKKHINIPPNRLRLKIFGGDLTRINYINNTNNISYDGYLPPIIPINNLFYNNENINISGDNELKLYRTKSISGENIKEKLQENLISKYTEPKPKDKS